MVLGLSLPHELAWAEDLSKRSFCGTLIATMAGGPRIVIPSRDDLETLKEHIEWDDATVLDPVIDYIEKWRGLYPTEARSSEPSGRLPDLFEIKSIDKRPVQKMTAEEILLELGESWSNQAQPVTERERELMTVALSQRPAESLELFLLKMRPLEKSQQAALPPVERITKPKAERISIFVNQVLLARTIEAESFHREVSKEVLKNWIFRVAREILIPLEFDSDQSHLVLVEDAWTFLRNRGPSFEDSFHPQTDSDLHSPKVEDPLAEVQALEVWDPEHIEQQDALKARIASHLEAEMKVDKLRWGLFHLLEDVNERYSPELRSHSPLIDGQEMPKVTHPSKTPEGKDWTYFLSNRKGIYRLRESHERISGQIAWLSERIQQRSDLDDFQKLAGLLEKRQELLRTLVDLVKKVELKLMSNSLEPGLHRELHFMLSELSSIPADLARQNGELKDSLDQSDFDLQYALPLEQLDSVFEPVFQWLESSVSFPFWLNNPDYNPEKGAEVLEKLRQQGLRWNNLPKSMRTKLGRAEDPLAYLQEHFKLFESFADIQMVYDGPPILMEFDRVMAQVAPTSIQSSDLNASGLGGALAWKDSKIADLIGKLESILHLAQDRRKKLLARIDEPGPRSSFEHYFRYTKAEEIFTFLKSTNERAGRVKAMEVSDKNQRRLEELETAIWQELVEVNDIIERLTPPQR
ncbi:MAG: hypothetical protein EA369_00490 [Bradymonadales bacterium]|nr:MAG: hypothetical protein EA369_00490 [Bradymonadales bacterium]